MQIQCNLTDAQMVYMNQCKTALEMWRSLKGIHDNRGHQALVVYIRSLYHLTAEEGNNIINHLNKMKKGHKHINLMGDACFHIPDITFKLLICKSLPPSWDNYMDTYIGSQTFAAEDPCTSVSSQHFIGLLKNEYNHREGCKTDIPPQVNQANTSMCSLMSQITLANGRTSFKASTFCKLCNITGHPTDECTCLEK